MCIRDRLRTALTMLGIVIGIASVVLMLGVGDGVRRFICLLYTSRCV